MTMESIWDWLFGTPNPTKDWREDATVSLEFDLDFQKFCGIGFGDLFERLSFLGPARITNGYSFPAKGLAVGVDEDSRITEFVLFLMPSENENMQAFPGKIIYQGKGIFLGDPTLEKDVEEKFGPPFWRDQDEDETLLFHEFGEWEWQFEFDESGKLRALVICQNPLLADEKQRITFKVTKPWPFPEKASRTEKTV